MFRWIRGWVCLSVAGCGQERFLNLCRNRGMVVWKIVSGECGYTCCMYRSDYQSCGDLIRKAGVKVTCVREYGLPGYLLRYRNRQAFLAAFFLTLSFIWFASLHLWDIQIENNLYYTDDQILSCLKEHGILKGIRKSKVDCEAIEQELRDTFERISWSAVSVEGTVLKVNVAENYGTLEAVMADTKPGDLVAETDGVVETLVVRKGIAQVKPGDSVTRGQVLVSGSVPRHNDAQEITGYEFVHADADVRVKSTINYEDSLNPDQTEKIYIKERGCVYHIGFGGLNFSVSGPVRLFWKLADRITEAAGSIDEIGSGFREMILPEPGISFYFYKVEQKEYRSCHRWLSEEEASSLLQKKIDEFLGNMQKNQNVVVENQVRIYYDSVVYRASGNIVFLSPQAGYQPIDYSVLEAEGNQTEQENSEE
ncbi:MAG: sporulation protein YqfD [Lachnospiraceae bacterium]